MAADYCSCCSRQESALQRLDPNTHEQPNISKLSRKRARPYTFAKGGARRAPLRPRRKKPHTALPIGAVWAALTKFKFWFNELHFRLRQHHTPPLSLGCFWEHATAGQVAHTCVAWPLLKAQGANWRCPTTGETSQPADRTANMTANMTANRQHHSFMSA